MIESEALGQARSTRPVESSHSARGPFWFAPSKERTRIIWLLVILAVIVGSLLPSQSAAIQTLERLPLSDKAEHFIAYALLVFLPGIRERRRVVLGAAFGALILGVGLEVAQYLTGWREFEVGDMIANAIGICLGLAVVTAMRKRAPETEA